MKTLPLIPVAGLLTGCTCGNPYLNSSMSPVEIQRSIRANYVHGLSRDDVRVINESLGIEQPGDHIMLRSSTCIRQLNKTSHGRLEFVYADDRLDHVVYAIRFDADGWDDRVVDLKSTELQP